MTEWKTELNCKNCNEILDIKDGSTNTICPRCQTDYEVITNEILYAICESGEGYYYKFLDNNKIGRSCFENPPIDTLEKAYKDTRALNMNENNPQILLDIIKKYHDSLKMYVRRMIELNSGNLTRLRNNKF